MPTRRVWFGIDLSSGFNLKGALSTLLLVLLSACSPPDPKEAIVGKWQDRDGIVIEFFHGGSMVLRYPPGKNIGASESSGSYRVLPDGKIRVTVAGLGMTASEECKVTFSGHDTVVVVNPDGRSTSMKRL